MSPVAGERDDAALLRAVTRGDEEALAVLYDRHAGWLTVRMTRRCAMPDVVDHAVQDTFLALWREAGAYRGGGDVAAFIWGIGIRRLIDAIRRENGAWRRLPWRAAKPEAVVPAEDQVLAGVEHGRLGQALAGLSPELRGAISRSDRARRLPGMTKRPFEQIVAGTAGASGLIFEAIPQARLREIKAAGVDEAGNQLTVQVDTKGGSPLRCCLQESDHGERMLLIAYTPPGTRGAYAERGPVFIHAEPCAGYLTPSKYPPGLSHRLQVVRAYDWDGRIAGGVMVNDGEHAMTVIRELLARSDVSLVHLRNVGYGCYNFAVRRVPHTSNERRPGFVRFSPY